MINITNKVKSLFGSMDLIGQHTNVAILLISLDHTHVTTFFYIVQLSKTQQIQYSIRAFPHPRSYDRINVEIKIKMWIQFKNHIT